MNYSPPRGDKTRPRAEAQPRKRPPGAEICLLITSRGRGRGRSAGGAGGAGARRAGKERINQGRRRAPRKAHLPGWGAGSTVGRPGRGAWSVRPPACEGAGSAGLSGPVGVRTQRICVCPCTCAARARVCVWGGGWLRVPMRAVCEKHRALVRLRAALCVRVCTCDVPRGHVRTRMRMATPARAWPCVRACGASARAYMAWVWVSVTLRLRVSVYMQGTGAYVWCVYVQKRSRMYDIRRRASGRTQGMRLCVCRGARVVVNAHMAHVCAHAVCVAGMTAQRWCTRECVWLCTHACVHSAFVYVCGACGYSFGLGEVLKVCGVHA